MAYPVVKVEIAFTQGPYVAAPTWTDVTSYVRDISIRRGRSDDFQDFDAGTATLTLDNRTRIFDPSNTAGTYYGNLVPRRQIKITATNSAIVYPVYRGYITGWPMSITDAGFDATVTLECYDALGLLANEEMPDDLADTYIRSLSPRHYWPLNDPIDPEDFATDQLKDYGSSPQPLQPLATFRTCNGPAQAQALPNTCLQVSEATTSLGWGYYGAIQAATDFSVVGWYSTNPQDATSFFCNAVAGTTLDIGYFTSTSKFVINTIGKTSYTYYDSPLEIDTNVPHHFAVNVNAGGTIDSVYIDGQALALTITSSGLFAYSVAERYLTRSGQKQQHAVYFRKLTSTEIKTIYRLGRGFITEGTVARFNRLIGYTPFPSSMTSTPSATYAATVAEISDGGPPITSELQLLSDSEGGAIYVSKDGTVTFLGRSYYVEGNSLGIQATFGRLGIGIGTNLDYRLTAENMRNALTMGFSGNGSIEVTDATSIAAYGTAGGSWPTQLSAQSDAETLGNHLISYTKIPQFVVSPYEVNVEASTASWATVLGLELLEKVLLYIPQQVGADTPVVQLIQSIEHQITPSQWKTTINGSSTFSSQGLYIYDNLYFTYNQAGVIYDD